jgi:hypothetical protein
VTEEYLIKCVVDPMSKKFYLYSDQNTVREVNCDTINQFVNVLTLVRSLLNEDTLSYKNPL